jgi:hypothetical protein
MGSFANQHFSSRRPELQPLRSEGRQDMKNGHFIIIVAVALMAGMAAGPSYGDEQPTDQQKTYYLNCIEREIDNYSCKVVHAKSRSKNLQTYGENAALKAVFLSKNRDALVQEMIVQKVSMRPHAVHHYLQQRFVNETLVQTAKVRP